MNRPYSWISICFAIVLIFATALESTAQERFPVVVAKRDIAQSKTIAANDIEVQQWEASKVPLRSLTQAREAMGKVVAQKIYAGQPILHSFLAAEEQTQDTPKQDTRIISIPVSISTKYVAGERVRLVYESPDGKRTTIVEETKVFHIGEPNALQEDPGGSPIFVRYVSVVASLEDAEKISNSMKTNRGVHILEKLDQQPSQPEMDSTTNSSSLGNRNDDERERRVAEAVKRYRDRNANKFNQRSETAPDTRLLPSNSDAFSRQLRQMAAALESQAAELEERAEYKKADLIRAACQNLREAARIESKN